MADLDAKCYDSPVPLLKGHTAMIPILQSGKLKPHGLCEMVLDSNSEPGHLTAPWCRKGEFKIQWEEEEKYKFSGKPLYLKFNKVLGKSIFM